ncbi:hypothetical protein [Nocardioides lijunqiniae]|uniref:hypothetical protein n=1 Tax=Nocardioides lijunqiniae TaxID=2760832 RepID=UPI001878F9BC|nr:hypothetical protein [Nocardioides lijunqiniae]
MSPSPTVLRLGAVLLVLATTGCLSGPDEEAARSRVSRADPPAADWRLGGHGLELAGGARQVDDVWVSSEPEDDVDSYLVTWETRVAVGQERARCAEAADWLTEMGGDLPGDTVEDQDEPPTYDGLMMRCELAIKRADRQGSSTITFQTWPSTRDDGYQFGPYLTLHGDRTRRYLSATLSAGPTD